MMENNEIKHMVTFFEFFKLVQDKIRVLHKSWSFFIWVKTLL